MSTQAKHELQEQLKKVQINTLAWTGDTVKAQALAHGKNSKSAL